MHLLNVIDKFFEDGEKSGMEKGLEKGLSQGRIEGERSGLVKGRTEAIYQTASAMKQKGISVDVIAECTGLSVAEIEKLNTETAKKETEIENALLDQAIHFAVECHAGAFRKGTNLPYILHPLETMQILASMKADIPLLAAGVLHDTVEDTEATVEQIEMLFGADVAELVEAHTQDMSKSWQERKQFAIDTSKDASRWHKMLVLADKVSNLRSMAAGYAELGDKFWDRFNAPKEKQAWYYNEIQESLCDLQSVPAAKAVYEEMVRLVKEVFA